MTNPQDIEAIKAMTPKEWRVWMAGEMGMVNYRLKRLESRRWYLLLGGGSLAGLGGAATFGLRLLNIL